MDYFLDTNTCIYALKGTDGAIDRRLRALSPDVIKVPAIVKAELLYGAEKSSRRQRTLRAVGVFLSPFEVVPFDARCAAHYGRLRADLDRAGTPIGPNDLIIAATVLAQGGVLVTHNTKEFSRVKGMRIEDWASL